MNKIKIAKELIKLAKSLVAFDEEDLEFSNANFPQYYFHADEPHGKNEAEDKIYEVIDYAIKHKLISHEPEVKDTSSNYAYNLYECKFEIETENQQEITKFEKYIEHKGFSLNPYL